MPLESLTIHFEQNLENITPSKQPVLVKIKIWQAQLLLFKNVHSIATTLFFCKLLFEKLARVVISFRCNNIDTGE